MSNRPPVFQDDADSHHSDTCLALKQAVERGDILMHAWARRPYPGRLLPRNKLPGLRTVGYWDARGRQRWGLDWHRNEGIELTWVQSGSCAFNHGHGPVNLNHQSFAVTQPWQRHRLGDEYIRASRLGWIILDVGVRRPNQAWRWPSWLLIANDEQNRIERVLRDADRHLWTTTPEMRAAFDQIMQRLERPEKSVPVERLALLISQVFVAFADLADQLDRRHPSQSDSEFTVKLFFAELSRHIKYDWTVSEMAKACGLGVSQFTALCRRLYNLPPNELLIRTRVNEAARLLIDSRALTVTDIAMRCGFGSSQYFAYSFRKQLNLSPTAWRASNPEATPAPTMLIG